MLYWPGKFVSSYSKFYEMHEIYILYSHTLSYMLPLKSFFFHIAYLQLTLSFPRNYPIVIF